MAGRMELGLELEQRIKSLLEEYNGSRSPLIGRLRADFERGIRTAQSDEDRSENAFRVLDYADTHCTELYAHLMRKSSEEAQKATAIQKGFDLWAYVSDAETFSFTSRGKRALALVTYFSKGIIHDDSRADDISKSEHPELRFDRGARTKYPDTNSSFYPDGVAYNFKGDGLDDVRKNAQSAIGLLFRMNPELRVMPPSPWNPRSDLNPNEHDYRIEVTYQIHQLFFDVKILRDRIVVLPFSDQSIQVFNSIERIFQKETVYINTRVNVGKR